MVPAHALPTRATADARLGRGVRAGLVLVAVALAAVFAIAWRLDPYLPDGTRRTQETHRQLGLPPCAFLTWTGQPCPSCGMTTAFALLVRGDVVGSIKANGAGTLLALVWLATLPWALVSAVRARWWGVRSPEPWALAVVGGLVLVALLRWGAVLAWHRWGW